MCIIIYIYIYIFILKIFKNIITIVFYMYIHVKCKMHSSMWEIILTISGIFSISTMTFFKFFSCFWVCFECYIFTCTLICILFCVLFLFIQGFFYLGWGVGVAQAYLCQRIKNMYCVGKYIF